MGVIRTEKIPGICRYIHQTHRAKFLVCGLPRLSYSSLFLIVTFRSHGTYYFIAAGNFLFSCYSCHNSTPETGCYFSLGNNDKAQAMLEMVPDLIEKKKVKGKDLPTEVFIKKKSRCSF